MSTASQVRRGARQQATLQSWRHRAGMVTLFSITTAGAILTAISLGTAVWSVAVLVAVVVITLRAARALFRDDA